MSYQGRENSTTKFLRADGVFAIPSVTSPPGAPVDAQYVVLALDGTLTNERRLVVGSPITLVDAGAGSTVTIDFDETVALGNNARVAVSKNSGATVGTRRRVNFIEGSNVTLTVSDDAGNEEVDVTIAASTGAPTNATYVVISNDATLSNERALAVGSPLTLSDGGANNSVTLDFDETVTLGNNARVAVRKNSTGSVSTRRRLNFIEGSNVTLTVSDDAGNEEVDITVAASGGGADSRFTMGVLASDESNNLGFLSAVTGMAVSLAANKTYALDYYVRWRSDTTGSGIVLSIKGPNSGSGEAQWQLLHSEVQTSATAVVTRWSDSIAETGTLTTSLVIDAANTDRFALVRVVVKTHATTGPGDFFLRYHGDVGATITIKAGTSVRVTEMG